MACSVSFHGLIEICHSEVVPSFVLLDVQESRLTIYVYELIPSATGGEFELKVQELKHSKA